MNNFYNNYSKLSIRLQQGKLKGYLNVISKNISLFDYVRYYWEIN